MVAGMTDEEIRALVDEEIKLHLAIDHRPLQKVPNFSEFPKPVVHRPISSNQPEDKSSRDLNQR
jgi:hypothetical protein